MTSKNNRAPLLCYFKCCASFHSHQWIQTGVTVRKRPILVKSMISLSRVTLKFNKWPWKTIGHLIYTTSSFVHHFMAIGEFKLELQPGNIQFVSKSIIFLCRVPLKFGGWPWKTVGHLSYAISTFVHHFITMCEFKLELRSGNCWIGFWPLWSWPVTSDLDLLHGHRFYQW